MNIFHKIVIFFRNITLAMLALFFVVSGAQAQTQDSQRFWSTVGSAGTVDEADTAKIKFTNSTAQMGSVPVNKALSLAPIINSTTSAIIRYNVTAVDALTVSTAVAMNVRYLDAGPLASVVAKLIQVNLTTGVETILLTFDSRNFPQASTYQLKGVNNCFPFRPIRFDFINNAYYVSSTLTKSAIVISASGIQAISIGPAVCIG
jgi:hypothetical protein